MRKVLMMRWSSGALLARYFCEFRSERNRKRFCYNFSRYIAALVQAAVHARTYRVHVKMLSDEHENLKMDGEL
jgi:hypothetical protein